MNHADHVFLLREGIPAGGGVWADIGSGRGAFTLALAELLGPGGVIYSVDRDRGSLQQQERLMQARFPEVTVHYRVADFTRPLDLPPLDGLVMANALHFVRRKEGVVERLRGLLRQGGTFLLVEYNTDRGNIWVPHPLSFTSWGALAERCGLRETRLLAYRPSSFLGEFYAAASVV